MCQNISEEMADAIAVHVELYQGNEASLCRVPEIKEGILKAAGMIRDGSLMIGPSFTDAHNDMAQAGILYTGPVADVVHTVASRVLGVK